LQLWTTLDGGHSFLSRIILSDRRVAAAFQAFSLLAEIGALFALLPRLRPIVGLLIIGFHAGSMAVLGVAFEANAILVALVLLPFPRWVPAWADRLEASRRRRAR
jgi:hypothetical protein